MERINMEDARIRVEFRKNETNEVVKSEWFNVISFDNTEGFEYNMDELLEETGADYYKIVEFEGIPEELQLGDRLPDETIELCKYFEYRETDEYFKEAFFYWIDNYHYNLLGANIRQLISSAEDEYVGYYEDTDNFVEEMFDAEYPNCPENLRFYIDFDLYKRDLMYDYFEIDGHIFRQ